jgi:putative glutathione S-transferase
MIQQTETIVSNESHDIMRMLSTAFDEFVPEDRKGFVYYPRALASQVDEISAWMQSEVNIGVYKACYVIILRSGEATI